MENKEVILANSIAAKCIDWNSARYEQAFNYDLSINLLLEEVEELFEARDPIEKLDAIGDITFVAMGVMWKLGFSKEEVHDLMYSVNLCELEMFDIHTYMLHVLAVLSERLNSSDEFAAATLACNSLFIIAVGSLKNMGKQAIFYDVVHAICDSNNTKEVKGKVDASIKANVVKGTGYVPPTDKLLDLYNIGF